MEQMTMNILAVILIDTWRIFVVLVVELAFVPTMTIFTFQAFLTPVFVNTYWFF